MSTTVTSRLRVALRLARRDLAAHKIRTVVALLLFALPVSLITGYVSAVIGSDRPGTGSPISDVGYVSPVTDAGALDTDVIATQSDDLTAALGALAESLSPGVLQTSEIAHGDRAAELNVVTVAPSQDGRGPAADPGTVVLNDNAAFLTGADAGDTVTVDGVELTVELGADHHGSVVSTEDVPVNEWAMNVTWYFPADASLGDELFAAVTDSDAEITTTASMFNPTYTQPSVDTDSLVAILGMLILGILLVSAVVSPVFAVAARRQRRAMGLLSATGAAPRDLRLVMFGEGLIVSVTGTALGLALSTAVAAGVGSLTPAASFHWSWVTALIVSAVAVVCGITSALIPALRAGREDPVQALADGASLRMTGFRWRMLGGLLFLVPGVPLTLTVGTGTVVLGIALCGIGVVLSSSLLVWLTSTLGALLPTAGRLAVRDSLRNHHRTVPAVAAVAGVTFLATVVLTLPYNTGTATTYRDDVAVMTTHQGGDEALYSAEISDIAERLGAASHHALTSVDGKTADGRTYSAAITGADGADGADGATVDATPGYRGEGTTVRLTDGGVLGAFAGASEADVRTASEALADGNAVVADPHLLDNGHLSIELREYDPYYATPARPNDRVGGGAGDAAPDDTVSVPGVVVPGLAGTGALDGAALSPETAAALDLESTYRGTVFLLDSPVSTAAAAATATSLWPVSSPYASVETPAVDGERALAVAVPIALSWMLTLGTVLLVVMLAATESRRDMSTITAAGAAPGLLRRFTATQAGVIALAGTVVGVGVGLLPAIARAVDEQFTAGIVHGVLTPSQWLGLGLTALVGPVLAWVTGAAVGVVTARDRHPVRR